MRLFVLPLALALALGACTTASYEVTDECQKWPLRDCDDEWREGGLKAAPPEKPSKAPERPSKPVRTPATQKAPEAPQEPSESPTEGPYDEEAPAESEQPGEQPGDEGEKPGKNPGEGSNPGNDKEVGKSPFDGVKGEQPSKKKKKKPHGRHPKH